MPYDWNNGTGVRFYNRTLRQCDAIERLLMFGESSGAKCDIPEGNVHGRSVDNELDLIEVGRREMRTGPILSW